MKLGVLLFLMIDCLVPNLKEFGDDGLTHLDYMAWNDPLIKHFILSEERV